MKKYFVTIAMAMVMMVVLEMPAYANGSDHHNDTVDDSIINQESFNDNFNENNTILGNGVIIDGNVSNNFNEGTVVDGDITAEGGEGGSVGDIKNIGNIKNNKIGNIKDSANNEGNTQETIVEGSTQETIVEEGDVIIENPDKVRIATHLGSPGHLTMDATEYHGKVRIDHKFQKEILDFFLAKPELKPYVVKKQGFFTRKSAHSRSGVVATKKYAEQTKVYAFKGMADLKASGLKYEVVGYTDTFSKGKATLMGCFDQGVIDAGMQGANGLAVIKYDYMTAIDSTTTGLGGSGATGAIKGGVSSVYGAAIGYANSKATPETNPYVYGITVYIPELGNQVISEEEPAKDKPDKFKARGE